MRPGHDNKRKRRAAILLVSAMALSGCSSASSVVSSDSWLGSRVSSLFSSAKPGVTQPASPMASAPDVECPGVDIRPGASTLNIAAKPGEATAGDLRYQLSFGQTARECTVQGGAMSIKVGVQGRDHSRTHGRSRHRRRSAALCGRARGNGAQDHRHQIQADTGDGCAGPNPCPVRRCRGGPGLSACRRARRSMPM